MATQLQVNVHGPGDVRVDPAPVPVPGPRDAIVRVEACGICGSDVGYARLGGLAGPTEQPMPLGHELSGVVESVGADVGEVRVGQHVVLDPLAGGNQVGNGGAEGGFTPRLLVRGVAGSRCLIPIPEDMPFEVAALAEPLGVGMRAVDQSGIRPGQRAVVLGAGPIGLATVASLAWAGVEDVVAVDTSETRLAIAGRLGARATIDASREDVWQRIREIHGTEPVMGAPMAGSDVYVEATGVGEVVSRVLEQAKSGATLVVVGVHRQPVPLSFLLVMMKEVRIVGSIAQPEDWGRMIELLGSRDLTPMITHRLPLERFQEGLAVAQDPRAGAKVMITVGGG